MQKHLGRELQNYYNHQKSLKKLLTSDIIKSREVFRMTLKKYRVYVWNKVHWSNDCYEVNAIDPVDARNMAVQRLIEETGHGLDEWEITEVEHIKEN
jgi:hypothetical protein